MKTKLTLDELKSRYENALAAEEDKRSDINQARRELTLLGKERRAAKYAWDAECKRLVG